MMPRVSVPALAAALAMALSGQARAACETRYQRTGTVAQVIDGQTLRLEDGSGVRMIGALSPEAPRWWKGEKPWPPAQRARRVLEELIGTSKIELRFAGDEARLDRHGRFLAQLFILRGVERIWAQGEMIRRGFALAYSFKGHRACARDLQAFEIQARARRVGLWRSGKSTVIDAKSVATLSKRRGAFQIVEGRVLSVGRTRKWSFLNFGADWHTDFTVAIRAGDRAAFRGSDITLDRLAGKNVLVRGWIGRWNGPVIKATHPEQIMIVEEAGETETPARP